MPLPSAWLWPATCPLHTVGQGLGRPSLDWLPSLTKTTCVRRCLVPRARLLCETPLAGGPAGDRGSCWPRRRGPPAGTWPQGRDGGHREAGTSANDNVVRATAVLARLSGEPAFRRGPRPHGPAACPVPLHGHLCPAEGRLWGPQPSSRRSAHVNPSTPERTATWSPRADTHARRRAPPGGHARRRQVLLSRDQRRTPGESQSQRRARAWEAPGVGSRGPGLTRKGRFGLPAAPGVLGVRGAADVRPGPGPRGGSGVA